jgi:hypothetical protein
LSNQILEVRKEQHFCFLLISTSARNSTKKLKKLCVATVFLIVTRPLPRTSDAAGERFTAFPAKAGEERAIVEAAIETFCVFLTQDPQLYLSALSRGLLRLNHFCVLMRSTDSPTAHFSASF